MAQNSELDAAFAKIRALFAAERRRGEQDMMARIEQFLQGKEGAPTVTPVESPKKRDLRRAPKKKKERAPVGTARVLVERVLRERDGQGAGPKDIQRAAISSAEKLVSYSGIRFELDRGKEDGRYTGSGDKWMMKGGH
jgi:hypothetical protein